MGEDFDFVNSLGANVVVNYHKEHSVEFVFDNLEFQAYGNCQERSSSLSEIMQIVRQSVLRALTFSGRNSLLLRQIRPKACRFRSH